MAERLKKLGLKLLDTWKNYSKKQKTLIISVTCAIIVAFALLTVLMNKVDYTQLKQCENGKEMDQVVQLLDSKNIKNRYDTKTMTIYVDSKSYEEASLLLYSNEITTDDVSIDDLLSNSLSTTNADRTLKINLYLQGKLRDEIKKMEGIDDAEIYYIPKDNTDSIYTDDSKTEDTAASVLLTVNDNFKSKIAQTIAEVVAKAIGNKETDSIRVADQYGNLLFGGKQDLYTGAVSSKEEYKEMLRNNLVNRLYGLCIKSGYSDAEIVPYLSFDMNKVTELYTEYSTPDGADQGLYTYSKTSQTKNTDGSGSGTPGTSSNDATTYESSDTTSSDSSTKDEEYKYQPNTKVTNTEYEIGATKPDESSISIVLTKVTSTTQAELKSSGALKGTTYDAYVKANSNMKSMKVPASLYTLVSKATGIAEANITITSWNKPVFIPNTTSTRNWTFYLQIALAVLIVGLLLFVVFKGVKPVEVTELEPELSVEQLLATTKENQTIEDIEYNETSEVRKMIEKFVDEKPEAVAQLLRNWLNEDWN